MKYYNKHLISLAVLNSFPSRGSRGQYNPLPSSNEGSVKIIGFDSGKKCKIGNIKITDYTRKLLLT